MCRLGILSYSQELNLYLLGENLTQLSALLLLSFSPTLFPHQTPS